MGSNRLEGWLRVGGFPGLGFLDWKSLWGLRHRAEMMGQGSLTAELICF